MDTKYLKNVLLVTKEQKSDSNRANVQSLELLEEQLKKLNFSYKIVSRHALKKDLFKDNLVISLGGDGTLLSAARYCTDNPILSINSEPEISVGALCVANRYDFSGMLNDIAHNKALITPIPRMDILLDNNSLTISALNDILFCHKNPATLSRYEFSLLNKIADHRSSGLWVSTAVGSSGAIYSAGGILQEIDDDGLQFLVREPYRIDGDYVATLNGVFKKPKKLSIKCQMNEAMIYVDGPHSHYFVPYGAFITIQTSNEPLQMINGFLLKNRRHSLIEARLKYRKIKFNNN